MRMSWVQILAGASPSPIGAPGDIPCTECQPIPMWIRLNRKEILFTHYFKMTDNLRGMRVARGHVINVVW